MTNRSFPRIGSIVRIDQEDAYDITGSRVGDLAVTIDEDRIRFVTGPLIGIGVGSTIDWWYIPYLSEFKGYGFTLMKTVLDDDPND